MFFFFTCSSDKDENKDNIHDPNFMQEKQQCYCMNHSFLDSNSFLM